MYSSSSAAGLVSSYRKTVRRCSFGTPSFSNASEKFMFMLLAWPMWRKPLGSGGKRVRMIGPLIRACSASSSGEFWAQASSRAFRALDTVVVSGGGASSDMVSYYISRRQGCGKTKLRCKQPSTARADEVQSILKVPKMSNAMHAMRPLCCA